MEEEILEPVVDNEISKEEVDKAMKELDFRFARLWQSMLKDSGLFDE